MRKSPVITIVVLSVCLAPCPMQLYYAQRPNVQRLGRICITRDSVQVELSQHAMEARLAEVCILSASIFLSGFNID